MGIIQAHNVAKTLLSGLRTSWEQKLDGNAFKAVQLALLFDGLASNIQPVKTEKCVQTSLEEVTILTDQIINGEPLWQQVSALLIVSLTRLITVRVRYGRIEKLSEIEKRFVSEPISLKSSPVKSKRDETAASLEICVSILLDREDMDNQISMAKAIVKGLTAKLTPYCEDNFCSRLLLWNLVMSYWPIFAYFLSPEKEKFTDILAISLLSSECDNQHKCGPKIRSFLQERLEFAQFWESAIHLESSFLRKLCERGGQMINSSICLESHIIREYEAKPAELLKLFATQVLQSNRSSKLSGLKNECVPAIDSILHVLQLIPLTSDTLDYYLVLVFVLNTLNRCNSELQVGNVLTD